MSVSMHDIIQMISSDHLGRIEWLHVDGRVREMQEFSSAAEFRRVIAEELHHGVPINIVLYSLEGTYMRLNGEDYGTPPKSIKVIPLPNSDPEVLTVRCEEGCSLRSFRIGDMNAELDDFGKMEDVAPEKATLVFGGISYECGDMRFVSKYPTPDVLSKYNITIAGYNRICDILEKRLNIGACDFCN